MNKKVWKCGLMNNNIGSLRYLALSIQTVQQKFSDYHIFFAGSCSVNQECISIEKCPITKHMITSIKYSTNEEEKETMQQLINSRMCGEPLDETVCCDVIQGKSY